MKMSDISFLKPNLTELTSKFRSQKLSFHSLFSKTDFGSLGTVFTLSHSQFIFQHDGINSRSLKVLFFIPYLCTSSSELL